MQQYAHALPYHERAAIAHLNTGPDNNFDLFIQNVLFDARRLTQEAMNKLHGREKQRYIDQLLLVVNATGRVGIKYPGLHELNQEHLAALQWFTKAVGPNRIKTAGTIEINRN